MTVDSGLGHSYWDFAAKYSATIIMKISKGDDGVSSWFKLTGRQPNIHSILRFGSMCFVHVPKETRPKASFETTKAVEARLLGQEENVSGWVVRLESTGRIVWSRDVRLATGVRTGILPTLPQTKTRSSAVSCETVINLNDLQDEEEEEPEPKPNRDNNVAEDNNEAAESENVEVPETAPTRVRPKRIRPGWDYVSEEEDLPEEPLSTSFVDEQGVRHNPVRSRKPPLRFTGSTFMTSTGPNARTAYLASEVGCALSTGFDKDEPKTLQEALVGPYRPQWKAAMDNELKNLTSKGTWQEVLMPKDRKKVGAKWVLKIKRNADGKIAKYKARLVAKGYSQVPGIDFEETYAPVGRTTSLRILLTIAATLDLEIHQADVEGAYLNGTLDVDIYMEYPEGVTPKKGCDGLLLKKALYGLKQSGRTWWRELSNKLSTIGFHRLESDWGLYTRPKSRKEGLVIILVYVDDFVIAAETKGDIDKLLEKLKTFWKLSEMGEVSTILGMKVTRDRKNRQAFLTQPAYIDRLLERFPKHANYRNWAAPLGKTTVTDGESVALSPYQEIIGCLQWLAGCTRPDISYAASFLARHTANPLENHWEMALRTASYLAHTRDIGLRLGGMERTALEGWVDADWAGCHETRRSTTGYVFKLNNSPIVWCSRRQQTVASSTVEAEYIATAEAAREAVWLRNLLKELDFKMSRPTILHVDNQGAMRLAINPSTHQRTKHIDIKHHLIRELIESNTVQLEYIVTGRQQADILTKPLPGPRHASNSTQLGLQPPQARGGVLR